jgi:Na+-transporting NADH:ubiquinone oxidoreductase subunit B
MKGIRDLLDRIKPQFQKGGNLEKLHSTFDAIETFLFVPDHTAPSKGAHIRDGIDLKRTMFTVVIAMLPVMLWGMLNVGYQHYLSQGINEGFLNLNNFLFGLEKALPIIAVSYAAGLGVEFLFAQLRNHPVNEGFLVTGLLIPLCLPPDIPLWMVAVATIFAVVVGKEAFGGTGMNPLNPALTARVFLFFAYPTYMSGDNVWIAEQADGYSGATSLARVAAAKELPVSGDWTQTFGWSIPDMFLGFEPGSLGETSVLMCLIGGIILFATGVGSWKIMVATFAGGLLGGLILNALVAVGVGAENVYMHMPAYYHLLIGGFAFGAVYMATDPVSAAQTSKGKWIYGIMIGIVCVIIRVFNGAYPEGMMLAILIMNVTAPLIDHYQVEANIKRRLARA